jgi:hypothetical protein
MVEHHFEVMVKDNMENMVNISNNKKVIPIEVDEEALKEGGIMGVMVEIIKVNSQTIAQIVIFIENLYM